MEGACWEGQGGAGFQVTLPGAKSLLQTGALPSGCSSGLAHLSI